MYVHIYTSLVCFARRLRGCIADWVKQAQLQPRHLVDEAIESISISITYLYLKLSRPLELYRQADFRGHWTAVSRQ